MTSQNKGATNVDALHRAIENWLAPVFIIVAVLLHSLHLGIDDNWDLRNYHIYNPFAFFHKSPGTDIAPAQLQTFLSPTIDLVPYLLRLKFNDYPRGLSLILALPDAIAAILAFRIGVALVPASANQRLLTARWSIVLLALLFGITGVPNLITIGSSLSEMPAACFVLAGFLIVLTQVEAARPALVRTLAAGFLAGIAAGIKLTLVPLAVAAGVAMVLAMPGPRAQRIKHLVAFGVGGSIGALLIGGPTWLHLYRETGSPIFPYFNAVFRSPLYDPVNVSDDRFRPISSMETLFFPFYWAFSLNTRNSELPFRDPRIAIAYAAVVASLLRSLWHRAQARDDGNDATYRRATCFALFMAIGFVLWEFQFSIFRYLAPIELLSGFTLLTFVVPLLRTRATSWMPVGLLAGLCAWGTYTTVYPQWRSAPPGDGHAAIVEVPPLPKDSMVLMMSPEPMAYVAAYVDPAVRFVGVFNNIVSPGATTGLARLVESTVRGHGGPLWGVETDDYADGRERVLAYYGLRRGACVPIRTNLDSNHVRICSLTAVPASGEIAR